MRIGQSGSAQLHLAGAAARWCGPVRRTSSACCRAHRPAWWSAAPVPGQQRRWRRTTATAGRPEQLAQVLGGAWPCRRGSARPAGGGPPATRCAGWRGWPGRPRRRSPARRCGRGAPAGRGRRRAASRPRRGSRWGGGGCPTHAHSRPIGSRPVRGDRPVGWPCDAWAPPSVDVIASLSALADAARGARADRRRPRGLRAAALARGAAPPHPRGRRPSRGSAAPRRAPPSRGRPCPSTWSATSCAAPPSGRWQPDPVERVARGAVQATAESEHVRTPGRDAPRSRRWPGCTSRRPPDLRRRPTQLGRPRIGGETSAEFPDLGAAPVAERPARPARARSSR